MNLQAIGIDIPSTACPMYECEAETVDHILLHCRNSSLFGVKSGVVGVYVSTVYTRFLSEIFRLVLLSLMVTNPWIKFMTYKYQ